MAHATLSDIQAFLLERIPTHEALRAVAWLAQHAHMRVTATDLARELELSEPTLQEALDALVDAGLVCRERPRQPRYRYHPRRQELDADLRRTLMLTEEAEIELARMLSANSIYRLRRLAYLTYAPMLVKPSVADDAADGRDRADSPASTTGAPEERRAPEAT